MAWSFWTVGDSSEAVAGVAPDAMRSMVASKAAAVLAPTIPCGRRLGDVSGVLGQLGVESFIRRFLRHAGGTGAPRGSAQPTIQTKGRRRGKPANPLDAHSHLTSPSLGSRRIKQAARQPVTVTVNVDAFPHNRVEYRCRPHFGRFVNHRTNVVAGKAVHVHGQVSNLLI